LPGFVDAPYSAANAFCHGVSPQAVEPATPPPTELTEFASVPAVTYVPT